MRRPREGGLRVGRGGRLTAGTATIGRMASSRTPYPEAARELLRATLFGAARDQLEQRAWAEVTMSDIAAAAGVSRQTLYKEFGNRNEFGLAFVIHEGERFLDDVEAAVRSHVDDPRAAVNASSRANRVARKAAACRVRARAGEARSHPHLCRC